ncbi:MAG TPA: hypothetical protein ENJ27_00930 [Candidatus Moranbacteria bacterium]|nr:hypothetical protein [Candidatus Moranbacteria bacterium]
MKIKKRFGKTLTAFVFVFAMVFSAGNVFAQEKNSELSNSELNKVEDNEWQPAENITGVNCFDYYKFQSVQVSVGAEKDDYNKGEKINFKGNLLNENNYPVVDGNVFVRIGRTRDDNANGDNDVVDEFIALKNIVLKAKESKDVEFSWDVPNEIIAGNYQADFFFSVGKKFNLGGLPFSNEIIVGMSDFKIESNNKVGISFNRNATKVDGEKYYHIGNWPTIKKDAKVTITQPIKNTSENSKKVNITYDLYFWDSLNENDKISSRTEEINISANSEKDLEYIIPKMDKSVYYLKITAKTEDGQKTIVNIRTISQQDGMRLNYPAITKFPISKNDDLTLFTCFHNTSGTIPSGKVVVTLTDKNNKKIGELKYEGKISGAMLADKVDIKAKKDYEYIKLNAVIYNNNGNIVDKYETVYDCNDFDNCKVATNKNSVASNGLETSSFIKSMGVMIALAIILPLFVIVVVIVIMKNRKKDNNI